MNLNKVFKTRNKMTKKYFKKIYIILSNQGKEK